MIVERRMFTTLTINDFSILRTSDISSAIFGILRSKYKSICYQKSYIHDITKVLHVSDIEFNQNDVANCSCNVNVIFTAKVENIVSDEIVTDMKVLSERQGAITLGSDNKIAIVKESIPVGYSVGDYLPVNCVRAILEPGSNKIKLGCKLITKRITPERYSFYAPAVAKEILVSEDYKNLFTNDSDVYFVIDDDYKPSIAEASEDAEQITPQRMLGLDYAFINNQTAKTLPKNIMKVYFG